MTTSKTPFALGAYLGVATATSASGEAAFDASYDSFTSLMGTAPQYLDVFMDYTEAVSGWATYAQWSATSWATLADTRGATPVISLPMSSTAAGSASADQQFKMFASGQYDSVLQGIVAAWAKEGFTSLVFRPGSEMNLPSSPDYAGSTAQSQADWVAAFQHIYTVLHAAGAADGVNITVVWNPATVNTSTTQALTTLYPGNNYVDAIGADVYADVYPYADYTNQYHDWDTGGENTSLAQFIADPINREHYWSDPAANKWVNDASGGTALSLNQLISFAEAENKPFAVPETGAGNSSSGHDVTDDAAFPAWLSAQLTTAESNGLTVDFVNLWDTNGGGNYEFSSASDDKPQEAAAWAQYFGASAVSADAVAAGATNTASIVGKVVTGSSATAVANVTVELLNASSAVIATTATDATGSYTFSNLAAGSYQVQELLPSGYVTTSGTSATSSVITVATGSSNQASAFKLTPVGSIGGTVLLNGSVLAGATVKLLESGSSGYAAVATTQTSSTGTFSFGNLLAGTYEVGYTALAGAGLQSGPASNSTGDTSAITLSGTPGQAVSLATENMTTSSTVTGKVAAGTGTGVAIQGVTVSLLNTSGQVVATATTNASGIYSFSGLGAGSYAVSATAPTGYAVLPGTSLTSSTVAVAAGGTAQMGYLKLAGVGSITGTMLENGNALAGETVSLLAISNGSYYTAATTTTNSSGTFTFNALYARTYVVKYALPTGDALLSGPASPSTNMTGNLVVSGTAGQVISLAAETLASDALAGSVVVGSGTGTPTSGVKVSLLSASKVVATTTTNASGAYQFAHIAAGSYQVVETPPATYAVLPGTSATSAAVAVTTGTTAQAPTLRLESTATSGIALVASSASSSSSSSSSSTGLVLNVSEDAYQGDAQFTVTVNGTQVGGTYTATASNTAGQTEAIAIPATLVSSNDTVGITFLNDTYGGSVTTDRNLYLDSATVNGVTVSGRESLPSDGTASFSLNAGSPKPVVTSSLVLNVSEDAYQGNAEMVVAVDGQTQGYYTVTASHAAGQTQAITINDIPESFTAHDIAVSFVNDAYGGSASLDRNLYVNSMTFDGRTVTGGSAALMTDVTQHFTASAPANWAA